MVHGYTAVPVLNDQEQYIGSVRAWKREIPISIIVNVKGVLYRKWHGDSIEMEVQT